ncbi:MAG: hypothetical protein PWQ49_687 [Methanohalophilus sp.]|nr:hypothetical protein [Methanohalophilus sp.]
MNIIFSNLVVDLSELVELFQHYTKEVYTGLEWIDLMDELPNKIGERTALKISYSVLKKSFIELYEFIYFNFQKSYTIHTILLFIKIGRYNNSI